MKQVLTSLLFIVTLLPSRAQNCPTGPAQLIQAYYEYKYTQFRDLLRIPRHAPGVSCQDTAILYYNPADSSLHWRSGTMDITYRAVNGLTLIAADTFRLGGVIDRYTVLDDSVNKKVVLFKSAPPPGAVFNLGPWAQFILGEDTTAKTAINTNYVNDTHSNLNSPLMVLRKLLLSDGFNQVPFAYFSSADADNINGFYFKSNTGVQHKYEPVMETYANTDSTVQQHAFTFAAYMNTARTVGSSSTAFLFRFANLDSVSRLNKTNSVVQNANVFVYETGAKHPHMMDRFYHLRIGDIGVNTDLTANAQLEMVPDTAARKMLQSGSTGVNAWEAPMQSGGSFPHTPTATAQLEVISTTKGFLPPRMTTTQKNAILSPAEGLQVYDLTLQKMSYWNGTSWVNF